MRITNADRPQGKAFARFGLPIKDGKYPFKVSKAEEKKTKTGKDCLVFHLDIEASKEDAPEGPVKIEHRVTVGNAFFTNAVEVLVPEAVGQDDYEFDPATLVGRTGYALVKKSTATQINERTGEPWPAKSEIKNLFKDSSTPKPIGKPLIKSADDDEIPF